MITLTLSAGRLRSSHTKTPGVVAIRGREGFKLSILQSLPSPTKIQSIWLADLGRIGLRTGLDLAEDKVCVNQREEKSYWGIPLVESQTPSLKSTKIRRESSHHPIAAKHGHQKQEPKAPVRLCLPSER